VRICVDSMSLNLSGTGLGTYTLEFLKKLLYIYPQPQYDLLYQGSNFNLDIGKNNKVSQLKLNINRKDNNYSSIETHITSNKVDIYHSLNNGFSIPKNKECNYVMTVHDLLPVVNKNYVDEKYLKKFENVFTNAVKNSDKIIVWSESLGEELRNYFGIPNKKITVNYPGCSELFTPKNEEICNNILSSKYRIKGDYILHVGSIHIRKNLEQIIRAFKYINLAYKDLKLILIGNYQGKRKEYHEKLKILIEDLNLEDSIIFTGVVDYYDMPYFYSKAKCILNLSKYEGFPLTSLEAMACNTPVILNNTSFFKEVFDTAGLIVDANDTKMIVDAISDIIFNNDLKEKITNEQREISLKYKWEKNIINTIKLYESFY
jgi:glycosyltransferase involved in cell wall biosynthesis